MNYKKIAAYVCTIVISFSTISPVYGTTLYKFPDGTDTEVTEETQTDPDAIPQYTVKTEEAATFDMTVDEAVDYGLEHGVTLDLLENAIDLAVITLENAEQTQEDLEDAEKVLDAATNTLVSKKVELSDAQDAIDAANTALAAGYAPQAIPLVNPTTGEAIMYGDNQIVIPAGANILDTLTTYGLEAYYATIVAGVQDVLDAKQDEIDEGATAISEAEDLLSSKNEEFDDVLEDVSEKLGAKIDYSSLIQMDSEDAGNLMVKMAGVSLNVTRYAKGIYKNQIAMLIKKNYYDALYAEKVLELNKACVERGKSQYDMIKLSYDQGMKAKDDLLLSKMYYDSTVVASRLAEAEYKNAMYELKKNLNLDMNSDLILHDSSFDEMTVESLSQSQTNSDDLDSENLTEDQILQNEKNARILELGLESGLINRIEIRQALGLLEIYKLNESILEDMDIYADLDDAYPEAQLLREGAEMSLESTKITIKSDIMQSYELMMATEDMLNASKNLISDAKEVVSIAQLKYDQGFGAENALLKDMNLEQSSGTIVEVLAAQEKLADVEMQVANIRYNYIMAKVKYQNDTASDLH